MYELFPLKAGVVVALVVRLLSTARARLGVIVLSSVAFGVAASIISSEIFESLVFRVLPHRTLVLVWGSLTEISKEKMSLEEPASRSGL